VKSATFTEEGTEKVEGILRGGLPGGALYDVENVPSSLHLTSPARAQAVPARRGLHRPDERSCIIDEVTGRMMPGAALLGRTASGARRPRSASRFSLRTRPRLHHVQNYFRLYKKLAGMTGTASTEASEFGNLQSRGHRDPDQRPSRRGRGRRGLPHRRGEVQGDRSTHQAPARGASLSGRHHLPREVANCLLNGSGRPD
jgi:hypothetical protein